MDMWSRAAVMVLAAMCYGSFVWAILRFFRRDQKMAVRMKAISVTGAFGMMAHLTGMATEHNFNPVLTSSAILSFLLALAVFWWALSQTSAGRLPIAFSSSQPDQLIAGGPYRWVRHPIYLSYLLAWIGGSFAIGQLWAWSVPVVMGWQYLSAILNEERQLMSGPLAEQYGQYRASAGMLIPVSFRMPFWSHVDTTRKARLHK